MLNFQKINFMSNIFFNAKQLLEKELTEVPSLVEPILPKVGLAAVAGSSDTGKSSFLRHLALSIILGKNKFLGFKINAEHKKVLYVATEDDEDATAVLLNKAFDKKLVYENYEGLNFLFETENLLHVIDESLQNEPVDCVIIDAYSDVFPGSVNEVNQVRNFLNGYKELAQKHKCLIVFLHHTGKRTDYSPPSKDHALGSQGFEGKMRVLFEIRRDWSTTNYRHLCIVKGNYLPDEYKNQSFVLEFGDDLLFTNTNKRTDFEKLAKPKYNTEQNDSKHKYKLEAVKLKKDGKTHKQIAEAITNKGMKISSSTVGNWLKSANMN